MTIEEKLELIAQVTNCDAVYLRRRTYSDQDYGPRLPLPKGTVIYTVGTEGTHEHVTAWGLGIEDAVNSALAESRKILLKRMDRYQNHLWEMADEQRHIRDLLSKLPEVP